MGWYEVIEFMKKDGFIKPERYLGMGIRQPNSDNNCMACQTMCGFCKKMNKFMFKGLYTCVCFTCPKCDYRQHELMLHDCGKEPSWESIKK